MDIKHFYVEAGKGDPIILLHGNGENCDYFKGQIDEFATVSKKCIKTLRIICDQLHMETALFIT